MSQSSPRAPRRAYHDRPGRRIAIDDEVRQARRARSKAFGNHFQAVFQSRYLWLWLLTPDGTLVDANDLTLDAVGVERDAVVWRPVWETPWFDRDPSLREQLVHAVDLAANGETFRARVDLYAQRGLRHVDLMLRPLTDASGTANLLILEANDLSPLQDLERDRDVLIEAIAAGVVVYGVGGSIEFHNRAALTLLDDPEVTLRPDGRLVDEDGRALDAERLPARRALATSQSVLAEVIGLAGPDGVRWLRVDAHPLHHPERSSPHGAVAVYRDVTELRRQRRLIEHHTHLDPLTGLPNRKAFFTELARSLAAGESLAILDLDIDGFRRINEGYGHEIGDKLLAWLGRQLERTVRPDDVPARLGADEFGVLLRGVEDEADAQVVAQRIRARLETGPRIDGRRIEVSATMGIARGQEGMEAEALMREADYALAHAKRHARGRVLVFDEQLGERRTLQLGIEGELNRATEHEEFEVHYMPLVDAKGHGIVGAEALMRWRHPTKGLLPPAEFIPAAEESGQIVKMEAWLQKVCLGQLRQWNRARPDMHMSLNLSVRQLERPDFVERFAAVLNESGVAPGNVIAEVTETFAMQHPRDAGRILEGLADLGVGLAIDDFGTGYSNLGQLQHLPFQIVKIDRGFLRDVPEDQRNFALVRTIIAMAQSLDLRIIAEGVETKTQADFLYWEGANWLQGFHFGRPMPASTFTQVALGGMLPLADL